MLVRFSDWTEAERFSLRETSTQTPIALGWWCWGSRAAAYQYPTVWPKALQVTQHFSNRGARSALRVANESPTSACIGFSVWFRANTQPAIRLVVDQSQVGGDSRLRNKLIQAAWTAIRKDEQLHEFYLRIRSRHPQNIAAREAIVASPRP